MPLVSACEQINKMTSVWIVVLSQPLVTRQTAATMKTTTVLPRILMVASGIAFALATPAMEVDAMADRNLGKEPGY